MIHIIILTRQKLRYNGLNISTEKHTEFQLPTKNCTIGQLGNVPNQKDQNFDFLSFIPELSGM